MICNYPNIIMEFDGDGTFQKSFYQFSPNKIEKTGNFERYFSANSFLSFCFFIKTIFLLIICFNLYTTYFYVFKLIYRLFYIWLSKFPRIINYYHVQRNAVTNVTCLYLYFTFFCFVVIWILLYYYYYCYYLIYFIFRIVCLIKNTNLNDRLTEK